MTIRLILAILIGACGLFLLIAGDHSHSTIAAGVGLLLTGVAIGVEPRI